MWEISLIYLNHTAICNNLLVSSLYQLLYYTQNSIVYSVMSRSKIKDDTNIIVLILLNNLQQNNVLFSNNNPHLNKHVELVRIFFVFLSSINNIYFMESIIKSQVLNVCDYV